MKLYCNLDILENNKKVIDGMALLKNVDIAYMIKSQLISKKLLQIISNKKIYTTEDKGINTVNIYNNNSITIIDAFDQREGVTITEALEVQNKDVAIVNFYCCNKKIPTDYELKRITEKLREIGYNTISLGGSMLMEYNYSGYDELRVGEAFLTGYSTVYNKSFNGLYNPYTLEIDIHKENKDTLIVKSGFLELDGFTNNKAKCINTDFTVFNKTNTTRLDKKVILKPDYYTLIKLASRGILKDAIYI